MLSIIAGLYIWFNPLIAGLTITFVIAIWAIVIGILLIVWAIRLREEINDEWLMIIFAVLSIIFGILAFANLPSGYLTLQWIFAIYMFVGGIIAIVFCVPHQEPWRATGDGAVVLRANFASSVICPHPNRPLPPSSRERGLWLGNPVPPGDQSRRQHTLLPARREKGRG